MSQAVELDFEQRIDKKIRVEEARASVQAGKFIWLDLDGTDVDACRETLRTIIGLDEHVVDACLAMQPELRYDNRPECLHLVLVSCRLEGEALIHERLDALLGEKFFVTIHRDPVGFIERVKRDYHEDFVRYAKTPSFLLYELWDSLIDSYEDLAGKLDEVVASLQARIFKGFDDSLLEEFARLGNDLLQMRKVLAPARNVLDELGTRKSRFVSDGTQPFLLGMISRIERILQDVMVNREILSDALNLHVAVGDHRLNRIMEKLTVVTVMFLPLTFLTGIYGMNFEFQPEFKWANGYVYFWSMAALIIAVVLILMKRARFW